MLPFQQSTQLISFTPLASALGGEVHGVDLSRPLAEAECRQISDAVVEYGVLLFRDQDITPQQQVEFSRGLGELDIHVLDQYQVSGCPEVFVVSNVVEKGKHIGAYGVHDYVYQYETFLTHRESLTHEQKTKLRPTAHPAVRTHPVSRRNAIFLSEALTSHFEGMDVVEGRRIIKEITDFATQPRFVYRHQWRARDLVFWDNRSTMHRALPFDESKYRRVMHRTTIKGDQPFLKV